MPQIVNVSVRGMTPRPCASNENENRNETKWRRRLADERRCVRAHSQLSTITTATHFSVTIVFLMQKTRIEGVDLDNLAKPVLDTIFCSRYAQVKDLSLTGAIFDVDDDRVFKLDLEKRVVASSADEGVDITIVWE